MKPADNTKVVESEEDKKKAEDFNAKEDGKATSAGSTSQSEEEKKKKENDKIGGPIGAVIDVAVAALRLVTAVLKAVTSAINAFVNMLSGKAGGGQSGPKKEKKLGMDDEEEEQENEEGKGKTTFMEFLKNLFGMGKKEDSKEGVKVTDSNASVQESEQQSGLQFSPEMMSQIEGVMKGVQKFMQGRSQQDEKNPANKGKSGMEVDEVEESPTKPKTTGPKGLQGNEVEEENPLVGALQKMVDAVAGTKDPELMKQCQGILEGVNKENPELKDVTKGLTEKLDTVQGEVEKESSEEKDPMKAAMKEAGGVLNTLKNSESMRPASVMDEGDRDRDQGPAVSFPQGGEKQSGGGSR